MYLPFSDRDKPLPPPKTKGKNKPLPSIPGSSNPAKTDGSPGNGSHYVNHSIAKRLSQCPVYFRAKHDYEPLSTGDLQFKKGDMFLLLEGG